MLEGEVDLPQILAEKWENAKRREVFPLCSFW
jgi:hypothetical protein